MGNLAINKFPLEIENWKNAYEATNGNSTMYSGTNGFAFAYWPCNYTIDFEKEKLIKTIRFLLWDGLGNKNKTKDSRKYKFSLSISLDGVTYIPIYSNQNQEGENGWFWFNFLNDNYARYIRLTGHFNSSNREFHIVEFEVFDDDPPPINSTNITKFDITSGIPGIKVISDLIDNAISSKLEILTGIDEKIRHLDNSISKSDEYIKNIELIKKSHDFQTESIWNGRRSNKWLFAALIALGTFFFLLTFFVFFDERSTKIILNSFNNVATKEYIAILLGAYYVTKAFLLSTVFFIMTWCFKNYRSEKHNYVINKHKAMCLTVATSILSKNEFGDVENEKIFNKATEIIFSHQNTGYARDEEPSAPNIINTFLQKGLSSAES